MSRQSLAEVLDRLTEIEARFTASSSANAWDTLTAFIDELEADHRRVHVEEQIASLETAA